MTAGQARWDLVREAGADPAELADRGLGPVNLETSIKYLHELRAGDELDITSRFAWGSGKTFRITQTLRRADGILAAEVTSVSGVLDLRKRRLVADPRAEWRAITDKPELLRL